MGIYALITRWAASPPDPLSGLKQLAYSTIKVPALLLLTLLVTFPSLYVFNALVGSRLSIKSVLRLLVAAMGVLLAVLASFGTIIAFFSVSTNSYPFMVVLNVIVFAVSGLLGLMFLLQTLHRLSIAQEEPQLPPPPSPAPAPAAPSYMPPPVADPYAPPHISPPAPQPQPAALDRLEGRVLGPHVRTVFRIWVVVFALVGAQMGWVLRPFIGNPAIPVTFFRHRGSNFFQGLLEHFLRLF
jgi:hypothetical protein